MFVLSKKMSTRRKRKVQYGPQNTFRSRIVSFLCFFFSTSITCSSPRRTRPCHDCGSRGGPKIRSTSNSKRSSLGRRWKRSSFVFLVGFLRGEGAWPRVPISTFHGRGVGSFSNADRGPCPLLFCFFNAPPQTSSRRRRCQRDAQFVDVVARGTSRARRRGKFN